MAGYCVLTPSDAGVPGIPIFHICATDSLADVLHCFGHSDPMEVLYVFVSQLPGYL